MFFSIIIPVYNVEDYLAECLESVLAQTVHDWEAICVNDGSTDRSGEILERYASKDSRIKVVTQDNGGLSAARNTGLSQVKGEYVLFLDSDDWLEPNALEVLLRNTDGEDMICFSGHRYFEDTNRFNAADVLVEKSYEEGMDYYNENALLHRDFAFVCVVLRAYRRDFLIGNGLKFKEGIVHEDNLFTPITCYAARKVRQIGDCLYNYRVRKSSVTTTFKEARFRDLIGVANDLAQFFIPKQGFDKTVVYRSITHHYQVVFLNAPKSMSTTLRSLCDWKSYRKASRTKLRHRWNYCKNRLLS